MSISPEAVIAAVGYVAYLGNSSYAARNAAWNLGQQRLFVRPNGWADVRFASITSLTEAGMVPEVDFKAGGTAGSGVQIRWTAETLMKFIKVTAWQGVAKGPAVRKAPSAEEIEAAKALIAASK